MEPAMKLYAISDLHVGEQANKQALAALPTYPNDWLILAGDIGETTDHFHYAFSLLSQRFKQLLWVPGNHDLWTLPSQLSGHDEVRGEAKYHQLVALCRDYGVLTPEDPYILWPGAEKPVLLAPLFLLYDYSFRPDDIPLEQVVSWAEEKKMACADEDLLYPDPYPSRSAWCEARCRLTEKRLQQVPSSTSLILINHFPLHESLVRLYRIPRFSPWCGTRYTHDWHRRFPVSVVVSGHLHMRATDYRDGVRFEEVSLGYSAQWARNKGIKGYLRQILPEPQGPRPRDAGPIWHM